MVGRLLRWIRPDENAMAVLNAIAHPPAERLREVRANAAPDTLEPSEDPDAPRRFADAGARQAAFDAGEEPLIGYQLTPAQRRSGWERHYQ